MNYAKLPIEELEDLVQQQEQHLRELTEALLTGQRAHQHMKSALTDKRWDAAWMAKLPRPGCVVFFTPSYPPSLYAMEEIEAHKKECQARRDMIALLNRVGGKYELL